MVLPPPVQGRHSSPPQRFDRSVVRGLRAQPLHLRLCLCLPQYCSLSVPLAVALTVIKLSPCVTRSSLITLYAVLYQTTQQPMANCLKHSKHLRTVLLKSQVKKWIVLKLHSTDSCSKCFINGKRLDRLKHNRLPLTYCQCHQLSCQAGFQDES